MSETVTLVGLDFGTTTSQVAAASAVVKRNARSGRMEFSRIEPFYQPEPVLTPLVDDRLDEALLDDHLSRWFREIDRPNIFAGGALITGLAAQKVNASLIIQLTREHLHNAVVAVANDPRLESWLAFMGNSSELSRLRPETTFVNFDVGGGTTNIAVGRQGEVLRTGCYFVGARHVAVDPGGYRVTRLSIYARRLLEDLKIRKAVGDTLAPDDVAAIVDWNLNLLETVVTRGSAARLDDVAALHQQVPLEMPDAAGDMAITLSGGVGQLVYRHLQTGTWPTTTAFGDLGVDLAQRLAASAFWRPHLRRFVPTAQGRATVYGLLRHSTQVSGATVYLPDPACLPLGDLILLGRLAPSSSEADVDRLVGLALRARLGGCIRIEWDDCPRPPVRELAERIGRSIGRQTTPGGVPLVFFMRENLGKVFGQYLTGWGTAPWRVVVIDEIEERDAQFAHLGAAGEQVIPVSFYGMN